MKTGTLAVISACAAMSKAQSDCALSSASPKLNVHSKLSLSNTKSQVLFKKKKEIQLLNKPT